MVVTRRQSAGPAPAMASRTNSSTGSPRPSKGKAVDKSSPLKDSAAGPSHVPPNGTPSRAPPVGPETVDDIKFDSDPPSLPPKSLPPKATSPKSRSKNKAKKHTKAKQRYPNKGISIFDIIARVFLVWFTVYTLSVCPDDVNLRSPVCRALTQYRRLFLEPYVYPPVRAALDHPSIAPHIQRVQPYYDRAVQVSTPWVYRGRREWRNRVVPQVEWLQLRARPYIRRVERQYDATAGPYVRQVSTTVARYRLKAEPYVLYAALQAHRGWEISKPYVIPVWLGAKRVPGLVAEHVGKPLGEARRQWVDPQVIKIWDAVVEQGNAETPKVKTASAKDVKATISASSTPKSTEPLATSTVPVNDIPEPSSGTALLSPPIPEPTDEAAASASSIVMESASASMVADSSSSTRFATSAIPVDDIPEPSSESVSLATPPIPAPTDEAAMSAYSIISESLSASSSSSDAPVLVPSDVSAESSSPAQPPPPMDEEDLEDLESFLSDLELSEEEQPPPPPPPPPVPEETEEEKAERLRLEEIEKAEKRAEIEGRHTQWEIDLEKFGKAQRREVKSRLTHLREAAAEEARAPGAAVRVHVEGLLQEAEKSLKALNVYARKLAAEAKTESEKLDAWERVVSKVDKKFGDRVDAAAEGVREWLDAHVQKEYYEISNIVNAVNDLAERAQADIGMDYAWLPGVTYLDWQRYHDLVRTAHKFGELYRAMQNGTAPNAPPNPVSEIMESLQEEVDDMILGFETNLSRIKTSAIESFVATKQSKPKSGEPSPEPEVSILPIDPDAAKEKVWGVPPVILSRGVEEVEAAASRAEEAESRATHTEL